MRRLAKNNSHQIIHFMNVKKVEEDEKEQVYNHNQGAFS